MAKTFQAGALIEGVGERFQGNMKDFGELSTFLDGFAGEVKPEEAAAQEEKSEAKEQKPKAQPGGECCLWS